MIPNIEVFDILNELKDLSEKLHCRQIANRVLEDEKFPIWSGSGKEGKHHYGDSGLVIHTHQVVKLCLMNNTFFDCPANEKLLFLAALFHDIGKCWDYAKDENEVWGYTPHQNKIHHITRSILVFTEAAKGHLYDHDIDEIIHTILSHHGRPEWSSPRTPRTSMAWCLHLCDSLSARLWECE